MLHFNEGPPSAPQKQSNGTGADGSKAWKILVYDDFGQQIISPLLRIADLRDAGVTVHMYAQIVMSDE
jgi:hypothetical protein